MFQINYYGIKKAVCYPIREEHIFEENEGGTDIYWTPNNFSGFGKRKKEDLAEITSFFCEIDEGDKKSQIEKIRNYLIPSCIIETKRGLHVYWYLKEPIDCRKDPIEKADWYRSVLKNRICPALGADTQAADACRLMRAAFMRYWKDGLGEFRTDIIFDSEKTYELNDVLNAFPEFHVKRTEKSPIVEPRAVKAVKTEGSGLWERSNNLPVRESLEKLSGTSAVISETFSFKREGKLERIYCNGKKSNAWIDANGKIGSTDDAGPAIPNWLFYYHRDWKRVAELLKEYFPEIV